MGTSSGEEKGGGNRERFLPAGHAALRNQVPDDRSADRASSFRPAGAHAAGPVRPHPDLFPLLRHPGQPADPRVPGKARVQGKELKRKAEGVVYKRRVQTSLEKTEAFFSGGPSPEDSQIGREIAFFRDRYPNLRPACLIVYDREAYFEPAGDLRLTVDYAPRFRTDRLTLDHPDACAPLLAPGGAILEIKVQQALPLWLSHALDAGEIRKSSFSKYGEAWRLTHAAGTARTGKERKPCLIPSLRLPSPRASFS